MEYYGQVWATLTATFHEVLTDFIHAGDWVGNPEATFVAVVTWGMKSFIICTLQQLIRGR